jgi:prevent-host-death family protein
MSRTITQRELRNNSGEIMRALDMGEKFLVTRNGVPVAELTPVRPRQFVPIGDVLAAFGVLPADDYAALSDELDAVADPDPTPRA